MVKLPEKTIPATRRKIRLLLVLLWIIIFPLICFLLYLIHYEFSRGEIISDYIFIAALLGVFLLGLTFLTERYSPQPVTLTTEGIKVILYNKAKFVAWSEISHIEEHVINIHGGGTRTVWLHLRDGQNIDEIFVGKNKWKKRFYNTGILNVPTVHLRLSHKKFLNLIEKYFQNSKTV